MNFYSFHLGDYAAHTKHLSLLEDLAYRRMLDLYYTNEKPLPLEPEKVARLIGMRDHISQVSDVLSDFFVKSEEGYISKRADEEISKYKAKAERAKSANNARWSGDKSKDSLKSDMKSDADQLPTNNQEPITNNHKKEKTTPTASPVGFAEFWQAYPKKAAKGAAEKIWARIKPDADLQAKILRSVAAGARSSEWAKDGGQFIPHPATWLNDKRWEDGGANLTVVGYVDPRWRGAK